MTDARDGADGAREDTYDATAAREDDGGTSAPRGGTDGVTGVRAASAGGVTGVPGSTGGSAILTRQQEIADYVAQVGRALADLPPAVRDELLEDLPEHLAEVSAEADGTLVGRLGTPEAYAAELRAATGLATDGPGAVPGRPTLDHRVAALTAQVRRRVNAVDVRLGPALGYGHASDFLRLLRPAWWVLRGYLLAMLLTVMSGGGPVGILPRLGGSELAGLVALVGLVLGSIWLGRRGDRLGRWPRRTVGLVGAFTVLFGLFLVFEVDEGARVAEMSYDYTSGNPYGHVRDVYVYDRQGRLIPDVLLFDQDGQPIRLGHPWCRDAMAFPGSEEAELYRPNRAADTIWQSYPYCPQYAPFPPDGVAGPTGQPVPASTAPSPGAATPTASTAPAVTPTAPVPAPGTSVTPSPGASAPLSTPDGSAPGASASGTPAPPG